MKTAPNLIVALDKPDRYAIDALVDQLSPRQCRLKIGNILFTHFGPRLVEQLMQRGFEIFLDLKYHDIPQTVAGACAQAAALGVWMVNVHVHSGPQALATARAALDRVANPPLLIGVTVLTSLAPSDLAALGISLSPAELVQRYTQMAVDAQLDGVVCSAQEASLLRAQFGSELVLVTPGIRLDASPQDDQKRVMTPRAALVAGADYLVVGRPITEAPQPAQVVADILAVI